MHTIHSRRFVMTTLAAALLGIAGTAFASSHREAPGITKSPKVDASDFYMFRSYEANRAGFVTLIANYLPLQDAYGGPNYFSLDPNALYEIHIDNNGDAKEDLTFQFRFKNTLADLKVPVNGVNVSVPLLNIGAISNSDNSALNVRETYTIDLVKGPRRGGVRAAVTNAANQATFQKPADNIGSKSIPGYADYARKFIQNINVPGCSTQGRVFVGQRKDPFVVNLGETFDLVNIQAPATAFDPAAEDKGLDALADKNVTTIALELPISCLTSNGEPVIGAWTTASLRQARLLNPNPKSDNNSASAEGGAWTQVSRLGMPLVNEVVIGLKDKDKFNASKPVNDGQFATYVTNPTLPALLQILFGSAGVKAPTNFPRNDLVAAFLTGVDGLNKPKNVVASEMLRLNTGIAPAAKADQKRLGVIGGDNAGFPNGRRPGDDVVDIALRVVMGRLCVLNIGCKPSDAVSGGIDFTDGALQSPMQFDDTFPYLKPALPGSPATIR
ncbi:uncharacterized protein DUF4331 [Fluviicoccus keumensis]|uniref:Uncharacterized protein DUF4331 n=1 Tax=Fluviicoccus keumensis TaxID=1435465 RepID=A0A4Q7Z9L6_9GAMM|nr:DUF4331 domain-containing protein [Fluviicoccus keumensis]RZU47247.1 uncharacterized protein DUF4331 [Fluviicoccus keumensis]